MDLVSNKDIQPKTGGSLLSKYLRFQSSIYGRVVLIITVMAFFLFVCFGIIFRSLKNEYLNTVIRQNGDNIGSIVEGSLYKSMLENDSSAIQNTLDIINTMRGIDDVNMYDSDDNLVYTSFTNDTLQHSDPNCKFCHGDLNRIFAVDQKAYTILNVKTECVMNMKDDKHRHLLIKSPIFNQPSCYTSSCHAHSPDQKVLGSLIIKMPLDKLDSAVDTFTTEFYIFATLTTLLLALALIIFTSKKIRKPLKAIVTASHAVANGNMSTRIEISNEHLNDIRMVSVAFNNMLDKLDIAAEELQNWSQQLEYIVQKKSEELLEAQNELIHVERIASLGKLSSSVAHEINNPLSGVLTYTKLVQKQLNKTELSPEIKETMLKNLKVIENETKRCGDIVKGLLDFSKKDQQNFEHFHINQVLKETYDLMLHQMSMTNIRFLTDFQAQNDTIFGSQNQIKQACVALLVNAQEAVQENGEIFIRTYNPDETSLKVEISDNGYGIAPEIIPNIFEPFFSTKQKESGIGLGLAIVHGIIQNHKGEIIVKSEVGKGTTMILHFPLHKENSQKT